MQVPAVAALSNRRAVTYIPHMSRNADQLLPRADVDLRRRQESGLNPGQLLGAALEMMVAAGALPSDRRPEAEYLGCSAVHVNGRSTDSRADHSRRLANQLSWGFLSLDRASRQRSAVVLFTPSRAVMKNVVLLFAAAASVCAQLATGELRLSVTDPSGLPLPCAGTLASDAPLIERGFHTNDGGRFVFQHLPFGIYRLTVRHSGFTPSSTLVEIRSSVPTEIHLQLTLQPASTNIEVTDAQTLLDPHQTGVVYSVGTQQIREQQSTVPGRGILGLIDMQPGWLFEANGTLHPRGSEYQTLFVVDGVPMDENRSPAFAPGLETGEVQSMSILTANYPAEYGRKLGGVVEVTTSQDIQQGFRGSAEFGAGSFGTETGFLSGTYGWNRSALSVSVSGEHTNHYLDPPVLENYTNSATLGGVTAAYDRDLSDSDRIHFYVRRIQSSFEAPNESLQQAAGQRQDRNSREDLGQVAWAHDISADLVFNVRAAVEDLSANVWSNALSTPIIASQQRGFRRSYFASNLAVHKGRQEIKIGGDAYYAPVTEALQYRITKPSYFDPGTPRNFDFIDRGIDREQSIFAQDTMRLGNFTVSTGLRWDH
ncbi:MAG: carboxypeptidase regulatory-like domain-containing protein [Bryobacteraceae bacterium]